MICRRCLRAVSRVQTNSTFLLAPSSSLGVPQRRALSTTGPLFKQTTSAATPAQSDADATPKKAARISPANAPISISSVPAGTPLKGLNFIKGQNDPVALEDHEYPSWLWDVLKKEEKKGSDSAEGDLFAKSKKQRRIAAKQLRKQQLLNPDLLVPKIPVYEQSIDLPTGDGSVQGSIEASNARKDLTKAMRAKRRGQIKEANFLSQMG